MTTKDDKIHEVILSAINDIKTENREARIDAKLARKKISDDLSDLKNKLYIGNGSPSIISRINKNTLILKAIIFTVSVLYIAVIGAVVTIASNKITTPQVIPVTRTIQTNGVGIYKAN